MFLSASALVACTALVLPSLPLKAACQQRRAVLAHGAAATAAVVLGGKWAAAADTAVLRDVEFLYQLEYPSDWKAAGKPVKTHLHETLLSSPAGRGVKLGVTVDPVKINSLEAFGTLEQVTERVLKVEEGRDGVKSVELRTNAAEPADPATGQPSYYTIEYLTDSSRGRKLFLCKYSIVAGKLYLLQTQASADAFDGDEAVQKELRAIVGSFRVGPPA